MTGGLPVRSAISECLARGETAAGEISGIGLTGQMHGLVLLDRNGSVLRPSIIWCDQRTEVECRAITEKVGPARLIELTANPALTDFTLPKIWWVQKHEPDVWARAGAILLPKDYIRLKLSGSHATDVADASGTLLFDVANRQWSPPMMEFSRLDAELLPKVSSRAKLRRTYRTRARAPPDFALGLPSLRAREIRLAGAVSMGIVRAVSGERDDRNFRRGVCRNCCASARSRGTRPHFLPRGAETLDCDGSDAGRGIFAALVSRPIWRSGRSRAGRLRATDDGSEHGSGGRGWFDVGAIPDGREDSTSGPERAGRAGGNFRRRTRAPMWFARSWKAWLSVCGTL